MMYYVVRKGQKLVAVFTNYPAAQEAALKLQIEPVKLTTKHVFSGNKNPESAYRLYTDLASEHKHDKHLPNIYIEEVPEG